MSSAWLVHEVKTQRPLGVFLNLPNAREEAFKYDLDIRGSSSRIYCVEDDIVSISRIGMNKVDLDSPKEKLYSFADTAALIRTDPPKFELYLAHQRGLVEAMNYQASVHTRGAGLYNMADPMGPRSGRA